MLIDILTIILILLVCALIIFVFITLNKLNRSIDVLSADIHQLIDSTIPVVSNLNKAAEKFANIADDAEAHMQEFNEMVRNTKEKFNSLSTRVKDGANQNPVINLIKNLNAFTKGISAFWEKYKS
ncbi:MAG: hypothetical protein QY331_06715 [Melioribacteraceae bacterium]|jgi:methyl-accepting chemotaxis protein|nr:hypothetical protein [Melioribacteraceae bacterium]WKZ70940.1 MAG: hypothetical protein QY331_06715 [Melioribacteraceae bacterium]